LVDNVLLTPLKGPKFPTAPTVLTESSVLSGQNVLVVPGVPIPLTVPTEPLSVTILTIATNTTIPTIATSPTIATIPTSLRNEYQLSLMNGIIQMDLLLLPLVSHVNGSFKNSCNIPIVTSPLMIRSAEYSNLCNVVSPS
jgi:hypothetical protein